jgi:hypothetical protein
MRSTRYRIVVAGELSRRYASAFDGMSLHCSEGYTAITGTVVDQAHLHGLLNLVGDLGLDLVSVAPIGESPDQEQRSSSVDVGWPRARASR